MNHEIRIEEERNKLYRMINQGAPQKDVVEQSGKVDRCIFEYMKGA